MKWNLDSDRPIYSQLIDRIMQAIISKEYNAGDKLPSVRDMAVEAAVNPNTMQKALSELERTGIIFAQRTSGRYITEDQELLDRVKAEMAQKQVDLFFNTMQSLGYTREEILSLINQAK